MLFGHQDKISLFKKLAESDNLSHAYLFYGYPQIGKFYFARAISFFLEYGEFSPSGRDKLLLDSKIFSTDDRGTIGVDKARELKLFLSTKPLKSPKRLAIIDDSEALTPEAESALLKIVEEPPESSMIIFIAHDTGVLFAPLLSRLIPVYFKPLSRNKLQEILVKNYKISEVKARGIARKSFGRIGRAIDLIKGEGTRKEDDLKRFLEKQIVDLYLNDVIRYSAPLKALLSRETALHRFNLNLNLQKKAVEYLMLNG